MCRSKIETNGMFKLALKGAIENDSSIEVGSWLDIETIWNNAKTWKKNKNEEMWVKYELGQMALLDITDKMRTYHIRRRGIIIWCPKELTSYR